MHTIAPPATAPARSRGRLALEAAAAALVGAYASVQLTPVPWLAVLAACLASTVWLRYRGVLVRHGFRRAGAAPHPLVVAVAHRWPTWVALALTADNWRNGSLPDPWIMLILPAGYLVIGGVRGRLADRRTLLVQLAGLAGYLVLIAVAVGSSPAVAAWLVVAGWGAHALWDAAHFRAGAVVPRGYAEWCGVIDAVIAVAGALFLSGLASTR